MILNIVLSYNKSSPDAYRNSTTQSKPTKKRKYGPKARRKVDSRRSTHTMNYGESWRWCVLPAPLQLSLWDEGSEEKEVIYGNALPRTRKNTDKFERYEIGFRI